MASIKKRPNGTWRARYRDAEGKEHARHFKLRGSVTNPDPGTAQHWLNEELAKLTRGEWVNPKDGQATLARFYEDWADRQIWATGTKVAMDLAMGQCTFKDVQLGRLRRSHVETWVKGMQTTGLASSTIRTRLNNVRSVLRAAVRDRAIGRDPSEGVSLPRQRRAEVAMTIPTVEDVGAVYGAAEPWFRVYIALCAFAGLRLGEASAVQLGDIDFLRRQLAITRQVQRAGEGKIVVTPPKYGSERIVFLPDELVTALAQHVERQGVRGDEGWLFVGQNADPPHQNTIGYWWRKTLRAAGLEGIRLHDLRHFFASGLIADGCDVVTVQRALGHAKATTTLSTYSHLWPTAEDRTRAAAGGLMRSSCGLSADSVAANTAPGQ